MLVNKLQDMVATKLLLIKVLIEALYVTNFNHFHDQYLRYSVRFSLLFIGPMKNFRLKCFETVEGLKLKKINERF